MIHIRSYHPPCKQIHTLCTAHAKRFLCKQHKIAWPSSKTIIIIIRPCYVCCRSCCELMPQIILPSEIISFPVSTSNINVGSFISCLCFWSDQPLTSFYWHLMWTVILYLSPNVHLQHVLLYSSNAYLTSINMFWIN